MPPSLHSVLTGDLVASRKAPSAQVDEAIALLKGAASDLSDTLVSELAFTRFRGDGWQVILDDIEATMRAMIYLRARLIAADLGLDTRISAGIGSIDTRGKHDLSSGSGAAFFRSGDGLDNAGKRRFVMVGDGVGKWQIVALRLIDEIVGGWTAPQAEAAAFAILDDPTQGDIATRLGITRQAVQLRLAGASMTALRDALDAFEDHFREQEYRT